jgi:phage tail sheath protein FI
MSTKRGTTSSVESNSARPARVISTIPIALVVTSLAIIPVGLYGYDSLDDALEDMNARGVTSEDGTALKYLQLGDKFNASTPIVLSVVQPTADEAETTTRFLEGIDALKNATGETNWKPDIVIAPEMPFHSDIGTALIGVCDKLGARTFYLMGADSTGEARTNRELFGSKRMTPVYQSAVFNGITYDGGAVAGWLRVQVDATIGGYGWALSISNEILPFTKATPTIGFVNGRGDETDALIEKQIMSFISHFGLRSWEYSTCSIDSLWQDARRVRIYDFISEAVLNAIFFAVDGTLKDLITAKKTLRVFMKGLETSGVLIGQEVLVDVEKVVETAITDGEFYFIANSQESMSPKLIHTTFNRTDVYGSRTIKILQEA